jgi:hypothetical protein
VRRDTSSGAHQRADDRRAGHRARVRRSDASERIRAFSSDAMRCDVEKKKSEEALMMSDETDGRLLL